MGELHKMSYIVLEGKGVAKRLNTNKETLSHGGAYGREEQKGKGRGRLCKDNKNINQEEKVGWKTRSIFFFLNGI